MRIPRRGACVGELRGVRGHHNYSLLNAKREWHVRQLRHVKL